MILVDMSGVMIANIMQQLNQSGNLELSENLIRHMVLNSLRMYNQKFGSKYGELVICCDSSNNWRKKEFPYYKAKRKSTRDDSKYDWNLIFETLNKLRDEIRDHFPYKVLRIDGAEADDIIGAICNEYGQELGGDPILILSTDKDFAQLQRYANVKQWNPRDDKWVHTSDPDKFLKEHIIQGDSGDGVPNIRSKDDVFVGQSRQKPIMKKKLAEWLDQDPTEFCDEEMLRNYERNRKLIDLLNIPQEIHDQAIDQFNNYEVNDRSGLLNYFMKNRLRNLLDSIQEF